MPRGTLLVDRQQQWRRQNSLAQTKLLQRKFKPVRQAAGQRRKQQKQGCDQEKLPPGA